MKKTILLVDDSLIIKRALEISFSIYQVNFLNVKDFETLVLSYEKINPDLIIINIKKLNFNSTNLNTKLKFFTTRTPLLILESSHIKAKKDKISTTKNIYFIEKPFTEKQIISLVINRINIPLTMKQKKAEVNKKDFLKEKYENQETYDSLDKNENQDNIHIRKLFKINEQDLDKKIKKEVITYCDKNLHKITKDIIIKRLNKLLEEKNNNLDL